MRFRSDIFRINAVSIYAPCVILIITFLTAVPAWGQLTSNDIAALRERGREEGWTFTVSENPATRYPLEQLCGAVRPDDWRETARFNPCRPSKFSPASFDWRALNGCTPIKNQRQCGSCWAFGTVAALECNILIKDEKVVDLSEQWLVSCNKDGHGCDGGWFCHDYFMNTTDLCGDSGAVLEEDFHYAALDLPCDCPYPHRYWVQDWGYVGDPYTYYPGIDAMKQAIMDYGPISVLVYANDAMHGYSGGVFNACEEGWTNHIVALVGWDDNQGDSGIWIMRNSWGDGWGEGGYMRIQYGCNYIEEMAAYVDYKAAQRIAYNGSELTDPLGDGDGIPEAGETINMTVTIANRGPEAVYDVSVELFVDDAVLAVTDDSTFLGVIESGDSVSNDADPFEIQIPGDYISRIDSFFFEITWNCGAGIDTIIIDTVAIEELIGAVSILLVDDDDNDEYDTCYCNSFESFRIPCHLWAVSDLASPDSACLSGYDIVFWFTGDWRSEPLDIDEIAAMNGYMNAGGKLFLTGQGIAAQLAVSDPGFLNDYLKSDHLGIDYVPILIAEPTAQVLDVTDTVAICGAGSVANQTDPDHVNAVNGGVAELHYHNSSDGAAVSYSGSYKLVFFAFGFEALTQGDSRRTDRDTVFAGILDFFNFQNPDLCPMVLDVTASPGEPLNLIDHTPEIGWSYYDPGALPQSAYHVQVDNDSDWTVIDMWDYGPFSGQDASVVYAGAELLDGERYQVRIRVFNGTLWSGWRYLSIRMNTPPTVPTNLTPCDMAGTTDPTPILFLDNAIDENFDYVTYSFEVYNDFQMTVPVTQADGVPENYIGTTGWEVDMVLSDDEDYFWRARADDGYEPSEWTEPVGFWVNSVNVEPTPFNLVSPENGGGGSKTPTFVWETSNDTDLYDSVVYSLYYAENPAFYQAVTIENITDTQHTVAEPLDGDGYYWKVAATDLFNARTVSDSVFVFYLVLRGDANCDGSINVGDVVFISNHVFNNGPAPETLDAGDANCDGATNIGDAVYLVNYIFHDGAEPQCP